MYRRDNKLNITKVPNRVKETGTIAIRAITCWMCIVQLSDNKYLPLSNVTLIISNHPSFRTRRFRSARPSGKLARYLYASDVGRIILVCLPSTFCTLTLVSTLENNFTSPPRHLSRFFPSQSRAGIAAENFTKMRKPEVARRRGGTETKETNLPTNDNVPSFRVSFRDPSGNYTCDSEFDGIAAAPIPKVEMLQSR